MNCCPEQDYVFREDSEPTWLPRGFEFLSGLPSYKRKRRQLAVFQAWIDDSGTKGTGKVLMMGGLFSRADILADVADRWDKELRAQIPLPIRYFKCAEARGLGGEFQDWRTEARNEKVRRLAAIVDRQDLLMVYCAVDLGAHSQMESVAGMPMRDAKRHPYNHPYLLAAAGVVLDAAHSLAGRFYGEKLEIIFDENSTFKRDVQFFYEKIRENAPEWMLNTLPSQLLFRDDKDFVLLQAADLLMGHARMFVEKTPGWLPIDLKRIRTSQYAKIYSAEELAPLAASLLEKEHGLPEGSLKFTVVRRPPDDGDVSS